MNNTIKKVLRPLYHSVLLFHRLNIAATIYLNFRVLPLRQAVRLPIYCYGKIAFHELRGHVVLTSAVVPGMIKIGYRWFDLWPVSFLPTQLWIMGTIEFKGSAILSGGAALFVQSREAMMEIGSRVCIGGGTLVKAMRKVSIGDQTRITGNCVIMDSNMHYVKNLETGVIAMPSGEIKIGSQCWINAGTTITKGTVVPDGCIVARGSFLSKDYSGAGNNSFLAGAPAMVKSAKLQHIFDTQEEIALREYFASHPEARAYNSKPGIEQ